MPFIGELSALLTAFLWSGGSIAFAAATKRAGSFQVNITRLILGAIYLAILIIVAQLNINLTKSQIINLGISGFIGLTLGDTFLFKAFREVGARISMLMMSLAPAIAAVLAFFILDETLSVFGIAGISLTVFGISIVVFARSQKTKEKNIIKPSGILYAFLGAVGQGAGLIFAKMAFNEGELNGFVATEIRIISSLIFLLPVALMTKRYKNPVIMYIQDRKAFGLTALGAVLGPFLGISFSLFAIEYTKVGIAATIMALVPIIMLPMVRYIYKEKLSGNAIMGAFLAVAGVAILFLR